MSSRLPSRLLVAGWIVMRLPWLLGRHKPTLIKRVLVVHHLLLGDTLMLTALLAKLRERYPGAEIVLTAPKAIFPLYQHAPYGIRAIPFDPRDVSTLWRLRRERGFDLALLPAENRYGWLAFALGARWVVAFSGDRGRYKEWAIDELRPYSPTPTAWGDTAAELIEGPRPKPFRPVDWRAPACAPFAHPAGAYAVLHLGASSALKLWEPEKWRQLAEWLGTQGLQTIWSAGRNEEDLVKDVDPEQKHRSYAGQLDLPQLWHLFAGARLLVSPDTGVAHLGRLVGTPTVTLFGPGSAVLCSAGDFWRDSPYTAITIDPFPCRDQRTQYFRTVDWVRRCERFVGPAPDRCPTPRCMQAISVDSVIEAAASLLRR